MTHGISEPHGRIKIVLLGAVILLATLSTTLWSINIGPVLDDYSQIANGRLILQHGISSADQLSWTSAEVHPPAIPHEWLYQVTTATLYSHWGFGGVEALLFVCRIGIFLLIALLVWRRSGKNLWLSTAVVLLTGALLSILQTGANFILGLSSRPQTMSLLLLLGVAVLLEYGGMATWGIVPLLIVGANWHGGFWPIYVIIICYYAIRNRNWWILLAPVALLFSPSGFSILGMPFTYSGSTNLLSVEWQRTNFLPTTPEGIVPFLILLIMSLGILLGKPRKIDLGIVVLLLLLAITGQRFIIFTIIIAVPLLAGYWRPIEEKYLRKENSNSTLFRTLSTLFFFGVTTVTIVLVMIVTIPNLGNTIARRDLPKKVLNANVSFMNPAMDYVTKNNLQRVLNTTIWAGDYMSFAGLKPFVYNRSDVFLYRQPDGTRILDIYSNLKNRPADLSVLIEKYKIEYIFDVSGSGLTEYFVSQPNRYKSVFTANHTAIYKIIS